MEFSNIIPEWKSKYFPKFLSQHFKAPKFMLQILTWASVPRITAEPP